MKRSLARSLKLLLPYFGIGLSFESKRELSIRNDMLSFAFHKIHGESNVEKKLERSWDEDGRLVRDRKT